MDAEIRVQENNNTSHNQKKKQKKAKAKNISELSWLQNLLRLYGRTIKPIYSSSSFVFLSYKSL